MDIRICNALARIPATDWDGLHDGADPFLRHAFLANLETQDCLRPHGWHPMHLLAHDATGALAGALLLYARDDSYGEFVFDWNWAEAYERAGGRYYPKLVSAIPFTPVTGERVLVHRARPDAEAIARALVTAAVKLTDGRQYSSWHCLFPDPARHGLFEEAGLMPRTGYQYHWFNRGYRDFDDFLARLNNKRRKQIRQERRAITASGLTLEIRTGEQIDAALWSVYFRFYCSTFHQRWGEPRLTEAFFNAIGRALPAETLLFLARDQDGYVAGAFAMRGADTLYGRHWGCARHVPFLHFELCYYQTIEYCITQGLRCLNAGAQGEHKIPRGFEPVLTHSAHWIADAGFRRAVQGFLCRETPLIRQRVEAIGAHTPYRRTTAAGTMDAAGP
jgi:predicted N-acyltransferase